MFPLPTTCSHQPSKPPEIIRPAIDDGPKPPPLSPSTPTRRQHRRARAATTWTACVYAEVSVTACC
jgi:hypothetical protein